MPKGVSLPEQLLYACHGMSTFRSARSLHAAPLGRVSQPGPVSESVTPVDDRADARRLLPAATEG